MVEGADFFCLLLLWFLTMKNPPESLATEASVTDNDEEEKEDDNESGSCSAELL